MKVITFDDIVKLKIDPMKCLEWSSDVIKDKSKFITPKKISIRPRDGVFFNTMPTYMVGGKYAGVKVITRYPEGEPSLTSNILLFDKENGQCLALIDGMWITAMRTGAVAAHSVRLFAKSNFESIGLIGLGNICWATMKILSKLYSDRKITLFVKKYKEQHIEFSDYFSSSGNFTVKYCDSDCEVIRNSDVIISAITYTEEDFCGDEAYKEGVTIVPIHTRGFSNCDLFFDKIYGDDFENIHIFKNFSKMKSFNEVSDVVNLKAEGRVNDSERIIVYSIGVASQDIYYAGKIFEMASSNVTVEMNQPVQKNWMKL